MIERSLVGDDFVRTFLIVSQFPDEIKDDSGLIGPCRTDGKLRLAAHHALSPVGKERSLHGTNAAIAFLGHMQFVLLVELLVIVFVDSL